jgi:hypothetical protein
MRKTSFLAHLSALTVLAAAPLVVFGQGTNNPDLSWLNNIVNGIGKIVNLLLPIVFALILLAFFWGLAQFVFSGAKDAQDKGKHLMLWSVIALFIAASIWGIVNILQSLFGVDDVESINAPSVPGLPR